MLEEGGMEGSVFAVILEQVYKFRQKHDKLCDDMLGYIIIWRQNCQKLDTHDKPMKTWACGGLHVYIHFLRAIDIFLQRKDEVTYVYLLSYNCTHA